jgi:hypothetical protein
MPISTGRALGPAGHYKMALVPGMGWQFGPMVRHDPTRKHIGLDSAGRGRAGPNRARVGRPVWPSIPPSHNNELSIRFGRTHTPRKRLGRRRRLTGSPPIARRMHI